MIRVSEMRSPAPRPSAVDREEVIRNGVFHTIARSEQEAYLAAAFIAWRFGPDLPLARVVATSAKLERAPR